MKKSLQLWLRLGDNAEYETFGDDFDALANMLKEAGIRLPIVWSNGLHGFESSGFTGRDYVTLFWGDKDRNFEKDLDKKQQELVEYLIGSMPANPIFPRKKWTKEMIKSLMGKWVKVGFDAGPEDIGVVFDMTAPSGSISAEPVFFSVLQKVRYVIVSPQQIIEIGDALTIPKEWKK